MIDCVICSTEDMWSLRREDKTNRSDFICIHMKDSIREVNNRTQLNQCVGGHHAAHSCCAKDCILSLNVRVRCSIFYSSD